MKPCTLCGRRHPREQDHYLAPLVYPADCDFCEGGPAVGELCGLAICRSCFNLAHGGGE